MHIAAKSGTTKRFLAEAMINGNKLTIASLAKCYDILYDDIRVCCYAEFIAEKDTVSDCDKVVQRLLLYSRIPCVQKKKGPDCT